MDIVAKELCFGQDCSVTSNVLSLITHLCLFYEWIKYIKGAQHFKESYYFVDKV